VSRTPEPGAICRTCRTPLQSPDPPEDSQAGKRSLERIRSSDPVEYHSSWPGKAAKGRMIDFSPKGMRFVCGEKLKPQTVLKISSRLFEASGTVTNVSDDTTGAQKWYAVGVCFLAVRFTDSRGTFLSTSA
jgi:hypothetical protein